jgi:hypothetical protein
MIELGTVGLIVNMLESQSINIQSLVADSLLRMACYGMISDHYKLLS